MLTKPFLFQNMKHTKMRFPFYCNSKLFRKSNRCRDPTGGNFREFKFFFHFNWGNIIFNHALIVQYM